MLYLGKKGIRGSHITSVGYSGISVSAPSGETLIQEYTVTAGNIKVDLTSTGMVFDSTATLDLSTYAGNDTDSTPYRMVFVGGSANEASFFVGGPGGGLAYGAELVTDVGIDNPSLWLPDASNGWSVAASQLLHDGSSSSATAFHGINFGTLGAGALIKVLYDVDSAVSPNLSFYSPASGYLSATAIVGENNIYLNGNGSYALLSGRNYGGAGSSIAINSISAKRVTDVPTTGVHCITAQNGSTRGFTSIDAGFNPNNITAIRVYEL